MYGAAMPPESELLDPDVIEEIENAAGRCSLDAEQAVVMVEDLVSKGVLSAGLSAALAPDAEARLSLRRFEGAVLPGLPTSPPSGDEQ